MHDRRPHRARLRLLQLGVAAGLLALLWHVADGRAAVRHLAGADPLWLAAAIGALTLQTVLSARRWRRASPSASSFSPPRCPGLPSSARPRRRGR